jgi:hypothetical protein
VSTDRDKADERYRKAFKAMSELPTTASDEDRSKVAKEVRAAAREVLACVEASQKDAA